jgi:hypothetical protein
MPESGRQPSEVASSGTPDHPSRSQHLSLAANNAIVETTEPSERLPSPCVLPSGPDLGQSEAGDAHSRTERNLSRPCATPGEVSDRAENGQCEPHERSGEEPAVTPPSVKYDAVKRYQEATLSSSGWNVGHDASVSDLCDG